MSQDNESQVPNQLELEKKWQQKWQDDKVFEPRVDETKEKFFATTPYPYANSALHIGHGRTNTAADIFVRYQRLKNKNVLFPMGFHISGTPVLAVADGIARGDEKQITLTKNAIAEYVSDEGEQAKLLESFKDPMKIADFFSGKIEETFDTIGLSIDWSRQFTTGDDAYKKFVQWQFAKLKDAGVLIQGKYPILYSPSDENAVGEDDIKDGDQDKVSVQEMKYIKFKFTDSDEFLIAATLRPDSLFGATNLFVKPDMKLVKLQVGNSVWIVSKASQAKIENQFDEVTLLSEHVGSEFIGKDVIVPILDKEVPIYAMAYPDENHGTGIVYSSPADSPHDYIYLFEQKFPGKSLKDFDEDPLKLTPITKTQDKKGHLISYKSDIPAFDKLHKFGIFGTEGTHDLLETAKEELYKEAHYGAVMINSGEFDETPLKNNVAATKVLQKLEELKLGGLFYETSRRAYTRSGDMVIVANLHGQWFLDYSSDEVKQKVYELFDGMTFLPENLRATQRGYLSWVQKRPCARKRGLGTPLPDDPEWVIEPLSDSTVYQMYYFVAHYVAEKKVSPSELTNAFFDYVYLGIGESPSDVATQVREEVQYWKSFDFRYTAPTHMSNHLSFLLYHYALIFPKDLQPKNITIGGLLIKDGHKISKSKGNGIPLIQIREMYGADLYRLYVAVAASYDAEMDFRDEEITQLNKRFFKWKELLFDAKSVEAIDPNSCENIDTWLISQFYNRAKVCLESMNEFKFREAYVSVLYEFLNDLSYHERRTSREQTLRVLRFVLTDYVKLMAPVTPHVCEELYAGEGKGVVSMAVFETDCDQYINSDISDIEMMTQEILRSVPNTMERRGLTSASKITLVQASDERFALFDRIKALLGETREFKKILSPLMSEFPAESTFIKKFVPKTLGEGLSAYLTKSDEKVYLESVKSFLETEFSCAVSIVAIEDLGETKVNPLPGKPGIVVE